MPIDSTEAVRFSNLHIRTNAAREAQLYFSSKVLTAEFFANGGDQLIPNTVDVIVDNHDKPITGAEATSIVTRALEFVADMEANGNAKLNTILAVALNLT